ncbi:type 4 prepilin peptidase 1 [Rahnella sp. BIGb0236]|uniref:prepilin peptidase n=1 Tax=Rahnella sp. BIGb0236 TaxID=2485117 RepID=UPI0010602D65|nr:A24 family peptidase [Rahnella sp. BIGb0236]TDS93296.1 type 4 prepilin peptidase 1 [Rahnella sp. BIGb0236]VTQ56823.1 peptidase A24 N- domain-containing protein [Campylobacter jejuni]
MIVGWQQMDYITPLSGGFYYTSVAIFGLLLGSFLNVVVYRLPLMIQHDGQQGECGFNLSLPASHCPACKHPLQYWQNIPVLSWLLLRGKCHYCAAPIAKRYPLTEAGCAVMFLGLSFLFTTPLSLLSALLLFWFLLALSLIDLATYLLPDRLTLPLLWAGLLIHSISGEVTLQDALYGAVAGYLVLWVLYWGVKIVSGKEGMGYGDFKLLAALGAWVGWQMLPYLCILAALTGIVFALVRVGLYKMSEQIPFGPCLALAGALVYISQESRTIWLMFS